MSDIEVTINTRRVINIDDLDAYLTYLSGLHSFTKIQQLVDEGKTEIKTKSDKEFVITKLTMKKL